MKVTLVLGGARSGKSEFAEARIEELPAPWTYVATAQAFDDEMQARIEAHQGRRGEDWQTCEAPILLPEAVREASADCPLLVDCLTLWLSNLMLGDHDVASASDELEAALVARKAPTVLVSNEVGLSIVPDTPLGRRFRDQQGILNKRIAKRADCVYFLAAGLPITLKSPKAEQ